MTTQKQNIYTALANWDFKTLENEIDNLKCHPNDLVLDKTCYVQGGSRFSFIQGFPLFTVIAWNTCQLSGCCPYREYDERYACLKRCLQKLKDKGADLEKKQVIFLNNGGIKEEDDHTRALHQCICNTYDHCPANFFEFLLQLGCKLHHGYRYNWMVEYLMFHPSYDYFKIALKHGLRNDGKIWAGHGRPLISVKQRFDAVWKKKIDHYNSDGNRDNKNMESYYRDTVRILKIKPFIDTGKADYVWAEIKREEEGKARIEKERLEVERKEKERIEKERIEAERQAEQARLDEIRRQQEAEQRRIEEERLARERAEQARLDEIRRQQQAERHRIEAERLAKIRAEEAERQRQLEIQRKKEQDKSYLLIALSNSKKCIELSEYLPNNYIEHNLDFLKEIIKMFNYPDEIDKSKLLENVQHLESLRNRDIDIGLDEKSRDQMGGSFLILALTNGMNTTTEKDKLEQSFFDYLFQFTSSLHQMANENIHPEHKAKILRSFNT